MKHLHKLFILVAFLFVQIYAFAQSVTITPKNLPYTIPILKEGSSNGNLQYRWLENAIVIPNATSDNYTIPSEKAIGSYQYVYQVKCEGCTDWLSSNTFTVNITSASKFKSAVINNSSSLNVTFSPQKEMTGYLSELITVINNTNQNLEIALYDFESYEIYTALRNANLRGVHIRMLFDPAQEDRKKDGGTVSHFIEEIGADVRYVNKINHHKFIISDNNFLVTSSGNWNNRSNSTYDENTLWITEKELILRYRAEFEYLWNNSREFGKSFEFSSPNINKDSLLNLITDHPHVDAIFTSSNYRVYNSTANEQTFAKISNSQKVADRIVQLINQSEHSIYIAANHLRSRPISEALIAKKIQNPQINIMVYLDEQEYISQDYNDIQTTNRNQCLSQATTNGQKQDCLENDFYYSYELIKVGIDVRFKTYSFKWHQNTSALMHDKYAIFDNNIIATGSYNYSYNSETNSMENVVIFDTIASKNAVNDYINNFTSIWNTGREENYYRDIQLHIVGSSSRYIPLLFPSMSLTYNEIRSLRQQIEIACPTVKDQYYKDNDEYYSTFIKGVKFTYDSLNRIINSKDIQTNQFENQYKYDINNQVSDYTLISADSILYKSSFVYNQNADITQVSTPNANLALTYSNDFLSTLNAGQGAHTWTVDYNGNEILNHYSSPEKENYINVKLSYSGLPISLTYSDSSFLHWEYTENELLRSIKSNSRNITFNYDTIQHKLLAATNDNQTSSIQKNTTEEAKISSTGYINTETVYKTKSLSNKNTELSIDVVSNNVTSGTGKNAQINYVLDVYGRVIQSGNVTISRKPFMGNINSITIGNITETRIYNDWELLTNQKVVYNDQVYYQATYEYTNLHQIKSLNESILGKIDTYKFNYDSAGQLVVLLRNDTIIEQYSYDFLGNRISNSTDKNYNYSYIQNQLSEFSWLDGGKQHKKDFSYNPIGQLSQITNKTYYTTTPQITSLKRYNYNTFGNLDSVTWANQKLKFIYDPYNRPIGSVKNGNIKRKLVYGYGIVPIAELNENERIINTFIYADNSTPIVMKKGSVDYYILSDIRGSVRMVIKASTGEIRQQIKYNSFGKIISDTNSGYTPFGFSGGLYDSETELVHFGARDYIPEIGRWTSEDPIGFFSGEINFYAYVGNDPINFTDPTGLSKVCGCMFTENEDIITVYRGVNSSAGEAYNRALNGIAKPRGGLFGHSNPFKHNTVFNGTVNSKFTSWTTNYEMAKNFALRPHGGPGVILKAQVPKKSITTSPDLHKTQLYHDKCKRIPESEVLLKGTIRGEVEIIP